ncbi:MAG: protein kinase [Bacteroidales bacterium]|nr:protein kinase [Bacteroidales bacterium]
MDTLQKDILIKERYRLRSKLGEGSFGEVWMAEDVMLNGLTVALKFYQRTDAEGEAAFTREYTRVQHMKHDNLLTATYFDFYEGRPFLVMDYCADGAAGRYCGRMGEEQIWQFIHDVAAGLAYMHRQMPPIIHQDIKPANVLLHSSGRFVITDFGISRSALSSSGTSEALKSAGTIAYMGPERFSSNAESIMASDVWSLGVCIFELATGNVPFIGPGGEGLGGVAFKMGFDMPELPSGFSRELNAAMQACLARETWDRPRAAQLADYAAGMLRGEHPVAPWGSKYLQYIRKRLTKRVAWISAAVLVVGLAVLLVVKYAGAKPEEQAGEESGTRISTALGYWQGPEFSGLPDGEGVLDYYDSDPDGRLRYTGSMQGGKRHGDGKLEYRNGNSFEGVFENDNLKEGTFWMVTDTLYFTGSFQNNEPKSGAGAWRRLDTHERMDF